MPSGMSPQVCPSGLGMSPYCTATIRRPTSAAEISASSVQLSTSLTSPPSPSRCSIRSSNRSEAATRPARYPAPGSRRCPARSRASTDRCRAASRPTPADARCAAPWAARRARTSCTLCRTRRGGTPSRDPPHANRVVPRRLLHGELPVLRDQRRQRVVQRGRQVRVRPAGQDVGRVRGLGVCAVVPVPRPDAVVVEQQLEVRVLRLLRILERRGDAHPAARDRVALHSRLLPHVSPHPL